MAYDSMGLKVYLGAISAAEEIRSKLEQRKTSSPHHWLALHRKTLGLRKLSILPRDSDRLCKPSTSIELYPSLPNLSKEPHRYHPCYSETHFLSITMERLNRFLGNQGMSMGGGPPGGVCDLVLLALLLLPSNDSEGWNTRPSWIAD